MKAEASSAPQSKHVAAAQRGDLRRTRHQPSRAGSIAARSRAGRAAGGSPEEGGTSMARTGAAVVTVNWLLAPLAPGVSGLVANAQAACAGKLEQVRVTALESVPPTDVTLIAYCACPPCAMFCVPVVVAKAKSTPTPDSDTVCALPVTPLLLSVMVRVPLSAPVAVGVNVTLIVQDALAATLLPQVLVWLKLAPVPMLAMASALPPVLLRVTACDALGVATL